MKLHGMDGDAAIAKVARRQYGLVTTGQAREAGLSKDQILDRVRAGLWRPARRGVYAIVAVPPSSEQMVMAGVLAVAGSVASHSSAAGLWGMDLPGYARPQPADPLELTVKGDQTRARDGLLVHRSLVLPKAHLVDRFGIPVTSVERTIVDMSGRVDVEDLQEMADDAVRRRLLKPRRLRRTIRDLEKGPGRRPRAVHAVLSSYEEFDTVGDSQREKWLRKVLRDAGLPDPVPQYRVQVGGRVYFIDLALPQWLVGLEYDSWLWHRTESSFHKDRERRRQLAVLGWQLVEVTKRTDPVRLVRDLRAIIADRDLRPG